MALAYETPMSQNIPGRMDGGLQRPQSALARGVQITELSDGCMNPAPIVLQESDILMEQYLSPTKLQLLTGADNLDLVETLELKVDTSETTLNNFGALLPNLRVLKLTGSVIPNIRDLGSSLRNLEVLWMSRCALEELDGISSMLKLRELYLAYNEVQDISPLAMLDDLQILDLEGNNVDDIGQIQHLSLCSNLQHLTLDGNPICVTPTVNAEEVDYDYRRAVQRSLVKLETLDDKSLSEGDSTTPTNVFDADWAYLEELQKDALLIETLDNEKETVAAAGRPTTAALKPATAYRPGSALRPSSGFRPSSSARRPNSISGGRPSSAWTEGNKRPASSDAVEGMESASELTCGTVICGNPSKALRARRRASNSEESDKSALPNASPHASKPPLPPSSRLAGSVSGVAMGTGEEEEREEGDGESLEEKDLSHLMEELQSWKTEHEKRLEKIRESKSAQVFTIDHPAPSNGHLSADSQYDLSDNDGDDEDNDDDDDLDFRPDSAMDRYRSQQSRDLNPHSSHRPVEVKQSYFRHRASESDERSFDSEFPPPSSNVIKSPVPPSSSSSSSSSKPKRPDSSKLREYERSLDEDEHLIREYERLQSLERQQEGAGDRLPTPSAKDGGGRLRELRVPSAGPRRGAASPIRRAVTPLSSAPFPTSYVDPALSPGRESPRPRKIRIGPTGLPGSTTSTQPQIRDVLAGPPGMGGLGGLNPPPSPGPAPPPPPSTACDGTSRTSPSCPPAPRPSQSHNARRRQKLCFFVCWEGSGGGAKGVCE